MFEAVRNFTLASPEPNIWVRLGERRLVPFYGHQQGQEPRTKTPREKSRTPTGRTLPGEGAYSGLT